MNETIQPPDAPPLDLERRKAHLLAEIARPPARASRPLGFPPLRRRLLLVAVVVLALTGIGTALAMGTRLGDLDAFFERFDREGNHPSIPRLIGDRAVIARGDDWAFVAWRSTRGLCTSLVFSERQGGTICGMAVVGAPRETSGPEHQVSGGAYQGRPDDDLWINGVAAANVSRVEVELTDGRTLHPLVYDAPAALRLEVKFFLARTPFRLRTRRDSTSGAELLEPPFRAFSAYDAQGRLLERIDPSTA